MSWEHDMAGEIKDRSEDGHYRDGCYLIGHVLSPHLDGSGPLIISILDGQAMLTEEMVDRISSGRYLREGMTVACIPGPRALRGGQRFFVQEIPGHGDILGRDAADSHPISAITGLRGELDDHDERLKDLENRRVKNLEHDMYDQGGKVEVLTDRVDALETGKADKVHTHTYADISGLSGLAEQVEGIVARGGEANVIETVKRNGSALTVTDKAVDIEVPVKVSDLTNDSGFQTSAQVQSAVSAGVSGKADASELTQMIAFLADHGLYYYPVILQEPQDVTAAAGTTAYFPIRVGGDGLSYEWWYANPNTTGGDFRKSTNTTDTYSIRVSATSHSNGFFVYCVVTDQRGHTVRTRTAALTVAT